MACRYLAHRLGLDKHGEEGFLAGLLHDIGKLLLLRIIEDLQLTGSITETISDSLIKDIMEDMHCSQGERLMGHLNMPEIYCQVVAEHHKETASEEKIILNLVKLSNLTCHKLGIGIISDPELMLSTAPEARKLMVSDLLLAELQVNLDQEMNSIEKFLRVN